MLIFNLTTIRNFLSVRFFKMPANGRP